MGREERSGAQLRGDGGGERGSLDVSPTGDTVPSAPSPDAPRLEELGLRRGVLVAGAYRIVRPLGAGGMGLVALARDEKLDRLVAVKFIRPELFEREELRAYFVDEARAMARVVHPNVLVVHAFGEHGRVPYFVMEHVDGPSAEEWLADARRAGQAPDLDEAAHILDQACLGVAAIHAAATVHRDLKPSNLLMTPDLQVRVSDLGVARILEGGARGGSRLVGSAAYMAPEAALGEEVPSELALRRDVYALGCIAYELLTGRAPFEAPTDTGLMAKHLLDVPPRATELRADLPAGYDPVLSRAVEKDVHRRWPTAEALRTALARARAGTVEPTRILIADDDPDWCALLSDALASRFPEARIDRVADGERAIEAFEEHAYSVVLVDLEMPEADGMRVTRHLRSLADSARTPIVVLTAAGGPGEWRRLGQVGADAFLVKPVDPDDVAMVIRRTLRARAKLR